nr:von Willebrand factor type A domain-containing protein [Tabrizicola sp.]
MTGDFDDLQAALKAAPAPDADAKVRAIQLAMENFDRLQGSPQGFGDPARSSEDRTDAAPLNGVRRMFKYLTSRPALAATTSVAALVVGIAVILPVELKVTAPGATTEKPEETTKVEDLRTGADDAEAATTATPTTITVAEAPASEPAPEPTTVEESVALATEVAEAPKDNVTADAVAPVSPERKVATGGEAGNAGIVADAPVLGLVDNGSVLRERAEGEADGALAYLPAPAAEALPGALPDALSPAVENTEEYANDAPNPVKVTVEEPVSTFSIDVDTASYAVVRSSLTGGYLPDPTAVRIEEMVNYFPYAYAAPEGDAAFASTISVMPTPWNPGTRLVTIGIQGDLPEVAARPPLNLVFLIDTSGSMEDANKLPLLKQSLSLMLSELRPEDQVSMVTYAGSAGLVLPPTAAADRATILASLENLMAGGSTAGAEGLELAYQGAEGMKSDGEVTRILLATDGDFNVGVSDPEGLEAYVAKRRETGTYLSILGFGRGNLDDAIMQSLAQNGNGTAAYIDTLSEARKVLVDQLTGALFPIADDV